MHFTCAWTLDKLLRGCANEIAVLSILVTLLCAPHADFAPFASRAIGRVRSFAQRPLKYDGIHLGFTWDWLAAHHVPFRRLYNFITASPPSRPPSHVLHNPFQRFSHHHLHLRPSSLDCHFACESGGCTRCSIHTLRPPCWAWPPFVPAAPPPPSPPPPHALHSLHSFHALLSTPRLRTGFWLLPPSSRSYKTEFATTAPPQSPRSAQIFHFTFHRRHSRPSSP
jgi:hypothetical protein